MTDFVVLGTDTDAGKTTFALLWLALFGDLFAYWKPVETGDSDSEKIKRLVPATHVHPTCAHFPEPLAPPLAARLHHETIPAARTLVDQKPATTDKALLIESFGGPFSPLNEEELQLAFIKALACPSVLVCSSALGAIGRTLQCLRALDAENASPKAVVLVGPVDEFALEKIGRQRPDTPIFSVLAPKAWTPTEIALTAESQAMALWFIRKALEPASENAKSPEEILAGDRRHVWHPYTSLREADPPLVCVGAGDEFLHLADGRKIIDGISSWWTIGYGHRYPPLMEALARAARQYDHVHFAGITHPPAVELAELLLSTVNFQSSSFRA